MCVCCWATTVAAIFVCTSQVAASEIPRISVAVSGPHHSAPGPEPQAGNGPVPVTGHEDPQSANIGPPTDRSTTTTDAAQGSISQAISDRTFQADTSSQSATETAAGAVQQDVASLSDKAVTEITENPKIMEIVKPVDVPVQEIPTSKEISKAESAKTTPTITEIIKPMAETAQPKPTITEIVKPVDESALSSSILVPAQATNITSAWTSDNSKVSVPKINLSVTELIKPVAKPSREPQSTDPAASSTTVADPAGPAVAVELSASKDPELKESAKHSEESVQQSPVSASNMSPVEDTKERTLERSVSNPSSSSETLTTVITPAQDSHPAVGVSEESSSKESIPNILGTNDSSEPVDRKPNAYTITPNEFAQKTAEAHTDSSENSSKGPKEKVSEHVSDKNASLLETQVQTVNPKTGLQATQAQDENGKIEENKSGSPDITTDLIDNGAKDQKQSQKNTQESNKLLKTSNETPNTNLPKVSEVADKIVKELNTFSEDLDNKWKERREKISWIGEAIEVLHTYSDKITETEKYNKCPNDDRKQYKERKERLYSIINTCERTLKRKDMQELHEKTSKIVDQIHKVEQDYKEKISQIPKEDNNFNARKLVIEDGTIRKLKQLSTEPVKKELLKLKDSALKIDEEEYKTCIDNTETKTKGNAIISETRTAIMKIYACV